MSSPGPERLASSNESDAQTCAQANDPSPSPTLLTERRRARLEAARADLFIPIPSFN